MILLEISKFSGTEACAHLSIFAAVAWFAKDLKWPGQVLGEAVVANSSLGLGCWTCLQWTNMCDALLMLHVWLGFLMNGELLIIVIQSMIDCLSTDCIPNHKATTVLNMDCP